MFSAFGTVKIGYACARSPGREQAMRRLVSRIAAVAALAASAAVAALAASAAGAALAGAALTAFAAIATLGAGASGRAEAAPLAAPGALHAAIIRLALREQAQFIYLGRPYCWYPYGWAGAGWYWCGYGTRAGLGWGGAYGWNGWIAPRSYGAIRVAPGYRFRHYR
jgi:hypothetical protein